MKFKQFKADMILRGDKTSSIRLFDDKNFQVGDVLELINSETSKVFARAVIHEIVEKPLGEIAVADLVGHESYESKEGMYESLGKYYHDVGPATTAKIVRFRIVEGTQ